MAAVKELLRAENDGTLSFGDYTLGSKTKLDGFEFQGDIYKVKTFSEITKLEKNDPYREQQLRILMHLNKSLHFLYQQCRMFSLHWNWRQIPSM